MNERILVVEDEEGLLVALEDRLVSEGYRVVTEANGARAEERARKVPFGFVNDMAAVFEQPAANAQRFADGRGVRSVALYGDIEGLNDLSVPPALDADRQQVLDWLAVVEKEREES